MSKKIFIPSTNLRKDLVTLSKSFIRRENSVSVGYSYGYGYPYDLDGMYDDFGYNDDYDDDSAWVEYYNSYCGKKGKKDSKKDSKRGGHRGHRGRSRIIDINKPFSGEEDMLEDDYDEGKTIIYYPDYHDKENRFEFFSLEEFKNFCNSMNYNIPKDVETWISYNTVCHCCLSSEGLSNGVYEIVAEESYGVLFYEVCDADEL